jgi:Protein of unknown function (DUF2934)
MPKATRANDSATPKKRTRKAIPAAGNGTEVAGTVTTPEFAQGSGSSPVLEEKIRVRAYQLYLQRGGTGGSPEQDWLEAKNEICGVQPIA